MKRPIWAFGGLAGVGALGAAGLFWLGLPQGTWLFDSAMKRLKAMGFEPTADGFRSLHPKGRLLASDVLDPKALNSYHSPLKIQEKISASTAKEWLAKWESAAALRQSLSLASEADALVAPPKDGGLWLLGSAFPGNLNRAVDLLGAEALARTFTGDLDGALEAVIRARRLAHRAADHPLVINDLIRTALISRVGVTLRKMAAARPGDALWLARLEREAKSLLPPPDQARILFGEASFLLVASHDGMSLLKEGMKPEEEIDYFGGEEEANGPAPVDRGDLTPRGFLSRSIISGHLAFMAQGCEVALDQTLSTREKLRRMESRNPEGEAPNRFSRTLLLRHPPFVADLFGTRLALESRQAMTLAVIKVFQHRAGRGAWPESLAEAAPGLLDPATELPFPYSKTKDGFEILRPQDRRVVLKDEFRFPIPLSTNRDGSPP